MLKFATYCLILLFASDSAAQSLIKCDDGKSFWVITHDKTTYVVTLQGDVSEGNRPQFINVEDMALQYLIDNKENWMDRSGEKINSDDAILKRFATEECDLFNTEDGPPVEFKMEIRVAPPGPYIAHWYCGYTETENDVQGNVYGSVIIGDKIFTLFSPKFKWHNLQDIRQFVAGVITNVKTVESTDGLCDK